jgi:hypothetical protein
LRFHVDFAIAAGVPCEFRFLNGLKPIRFGFNDNPARSSSASSSQKQTEKDYQPILAVLEDSPSGLTPLCRHIREITETITAYENVLRANRQKAMVIIITDGESSDGDLVNSLRPFKDLPVWLLLRFCTNEEKVIHYWNEIDRELELNMDVIDDYLNEAEAVASANPWLNYCHSLHLMREFGVHNIRELDKLDESLLSADDFFKICKLL